MVVRGRGVANVDARLSPTERVRLPTSRISFDSGSRVEYIERDDTDNDGTKTWRRTFTWSGDTLVSVSPWELQ